MSKSSGAKAQNDDASASSSSSSLPSELVAPIANFDAAVKRCGGSGGIETSRPLFYKT